MPAQLVSLDDGPSVLLDKPILLIGRHPECDIQIDSRKISRRHCCIAQVADYLVIRDLGSTNGIRINDDRVLEGRLNEGDVVLIGASRYRVSWGEEADARPAPPARAAESVNAAEDDFLESSDHPIPLAEPGKPRAVAPQPVAPTPAVPEPGPAIPQPVMQDPPILPDVLELANSDIYPNVQPHAPESPSHHSI
jgi:predicted component of type VI protein secretion system